MEALEKVIKNIIHEASNKSITINISINVAPTESSNFHFNTTETVKINSSTIIDTIEPKSH